MKLANTSQENCNFASSFEKVNNNIKSLYFNKIKDGRY